MKLQKIATPDSDFEQSFFQLAYEKLQEKLYNLLPYLVGFEIVNKSDDGTKALGVFGFKSNNGQVIYVPAFFVNGTVKGIDILYSKNNEQFYPLNEDFAELFLKDDATGIGDTSQESEKQIMQSMQPVDMKELVRPPRTGKVSYASVMDFVEEGDEMTKKAFHELFANNDKFMESVLRFYPVEKVASAIAKPAPKMEKEAGGVMMIRIITRMNITPDLPDSVKADVLTKGYSIVDKRNEKQKSKFGLVQYPDKFSNPDESGFYSYLTRDGSLRNALILIKPLRLDRHFSTDEAMVIDLGKDTGKTHRAQVKDIFIRNKFVIEDYAEVHKKMQEPAEAKPSFENQYILINEKLACTQPFRVLENYKDDDGVRHIKVECYSQSGMGTSTSGRQLTGNFNEKQTRSGVFTLILTKRPGDKLEYKNGTVLIPKGFKMMPIAAWSALDDDGRPGGIAVLSGALAENQVFPMAVKSNGSEYFVNVGQTKKKYKDAVHTKIALVTEFGLDEKVAEDLVDSVPSMGKKEGYIKLAYTGEYTPYPPDQQPYSNELGQPTYDGVGYMQVMPSDGSYTDNPAQLGRGTMGNVEGIDGAIGQASQLAQAGQKQIFDTHSIATLAKYVSPASKVQGYMPDFISCLDKLGRMLFLVYWETDKFEEMYGRGELPELVELLTNVFKNLGDLVIFLKRKSPEISINMEKDELTA